MAQVESVMCQLPSANAMRSAWMTAWRYLLKEVNELGKEQSQPIGKYKTIFSYFDVLWSATVNCGIFSSLSSSARIPRAI